MSRLVRFAVSASKLIPFISSGAFGHVMTVWPWHEPSAWTAQRCTPAVTLEEAT